MSNEPKLSSLRDLATSDSPQWTANIPPQSDMTVEEAIQRGRSLLDADPVCATCGYVLEPIFDGDSGCYPEECRRQDWKPTPHELTAGNTRTRKER